VTVKTAHKSIGGFDRYRADNRVSPHCWPRAARYCWEIYKTFI
jgi:hypothetical protein